MTNNEINDDDAKFWQYIKADKETWLWRISEITKFILILVVCLGIFIAGEYNVGMFKEQVKEYCGELVNVSVDAYGRGSIIKYQPIKWWQNVTIAD